jgi:hypothetical protein
MGFATRGACKRHITMKCTNSLSKTSRFEPEASSSEDDDAASKRMVRLCGEDLRRKISDVDVVNVVNQLLSKDEGKVSASTINLLVGLLKHGQSYPPVHSPQTLIGNKTMHVAGYFSPMSSKLCPTSSKTVLDAPHKERSTSCYRFTILVSV